MSNQLIPWKFGDNAMMVLRYSSTNLDEGIACLEVFTAFFRDAKLRIRRDLAYNLALGGDLYCQPRLPVGHLASHDSVGAFDNSADIMHTYILFFLKYIIFLGLTNTPLSTPNWPKKAPTCHGCRNTSPRHDFFLGLSIVTVAMMSRATFVL